MKNFHNGRFFRIWTHWKWSGTILEVGGRIDKDRGMIRGTPGKIGKNLERSGRNWKDFPLSRSFLIVPKSFQEKWKSFQWKWKFSSRSWVSAFKRFERSCDFVEGIEKSKNNFVKIVQFWIFGYISWNFPTQNAIFLQLKVNVTKIDSLKWKIRKFWAKMCVSC